MIVDSVEFSYKSRRARIKLGSINRTPVYTVGRKGVELATDNRYDPIARMTLVRGKNIRL